MRPLLVCCAIAATGCAIDSNPPPPPTDDELVRGALAPLVPAGATLVDWLTDNYSSKDEFPNSFSLARAPLTGGTLVYLKGGSGRGTERFYVERGGVLTKVEGAPFVPTTSSAVLRTELGAAGEDGLVLRCTTGDGVLSAVRAGKLVPLRDTSRFCGANPRLGPSAVAGHFTIATFASARKFSLESFRIEGDALVSASAPLSRDLGADWAGPTWFGELETGVLATVTIAKDGWTYERSDRPAATIPPPFPNAPILRRNGALIEALGHDGDRERWVSWNVDDGKVIDAGTVASLAGPSWRPGAAFGEWLTWSVTAGTDGSPLSVPTEFRMRLEKPGALAIESLPSTPCVSRTACRTVGESYPLGVVGAPEARVGLYLFWSWRGGSALWASPVAGRPVP